MFKPFKGSLSVMLWVASLIGLAFVLGLLLRGSPGQPVAQEAQTSTPLPVATFISPLETPTPVPPPDTPEPDPTEPPTPTNPPVPTPLPTPVVTPIPTAIPPIIPLPTDEATKPYTIVFREGNILNVAIAQSGLGWIKFIENEQLSK